MMRSYAILAGLAAAMMVPAAPVTAATPVRVTRFHLDKPITPAPVSVQAATGADPASLEQQRFADAVAAEMAKLGFTSEAPDTVAPLIATVTFKRTTRDETAARPPVSIGFGGGGFGGGGVGGGASIGFGVGKRQTRSFYTTELFVQLRTRSTGEAVWEGRATMEVNAKSKDAQPAVTADKLARALFRGFPGESGRSITVR